jgi:hypothetical protein
MGAGLEKGRAAHGAARRGFDLLTAQTQTQSPSDQLMECARILLPEHEFQEPTSIKGKWVIGAQSDSVAETGADRKRHLQAVVGTLVLGKSGQSAVRPSGCVDSLCAAVERINRSD